MWIAVSYKESFEQKKICVVGSSNESDPSSLLPNQAESTPDRCLHDQIRDVAFCSHQAWQLGARNANKQALALSSSADERSLRVEQVELPGELTRMKYLQQRLFIGRREGINLNAPLKNDEHVTPAPVAQKQSRSVEKGFDSPVDLHPTEHIVGQLRVGKLRPEGRNVGCCGRVIYFFVHKTPDFLRKKSVSYCLTR